MDIYFRFNSKRVFLFALAVFFQITLLLAQEKAIPITGKVVSSSGQALFNINVQIKGNQQGVSTDSNGVFHMNALPTDTLVFSHVNMVTQTIPIKNQSQLNVFMQETNSSLDEVIVIGYGTQRKSDLTGAIASISAKDLDKTPITSADQMLQGRASGLQLTQADGQPGSTSTIRIRGTNSINSGNEPLFVIDGFAGVGNLSSINPNDIQSIEVLKDASATAIYGSRGANGVILITTKKGTVGRNAVNIDAYTGVQSIAKKLDMMNATQFAHYLNDYITQYNVANPSTTRALPYTDDQISAMGTGTDWQDALYRKAPIQNYQVSFTGGTKETKYYLSLNHFDQEGIMRGTGFSRELIRMNLDRTISKKLKMGLSSQVSYIKQNVDPTKTGVGYGAAGGALNMSPIVPLKNADGSYTFQNDPIAYVSVYGNPVAGVTLAKDKITAGRAIVNVFGEYEIIPDLKFKSSFGVDYNSGQEKTYLPSSIFIGQALGGQGSANSFTNSSWLNENTLSYKKQINDLNRFDALVGFSMQKFTTSGFSASSQNYFTDNLGYDNLSIGSNVLTPTSNWSSNSLASFFGRVNYYFSDRYILTGTLRADGSSRFGSTNKWGYFPSGAFAWRVSNESFMKNIKQISDLKLRVSYGITGNQEIGSYQSIQQYGTTGYSLGVTPGRVVGVTANNIPNPNLSWESTRSFDIGMDIGLFQNRLSLTMDYYNKKTSDLLLNMSVPLSSGFGSILVNSGKVGNQGFELALTSQNIQNANFNWSTTLNVSSNKNKVLDMGGTNNILVGTTGSYIVPNGLAPSILRVGKPIGSFYGYYFDGIWQTQEQITAANRTGVVPGDAILRDLDGNGIINGNDRDIIGYANPKFMYGISNNISYKNFDLSIFMQGVQGNKILNLTRYAHNGGSTNNQFEEMVNAWNGANSTNSLPRAFSTTERSAGVVSRYLENGSYLRLQTVTLAYQIPLSKHSNTFKSSTIYITGQNLLTITKYTGYNPEVNVYDTRTAASTSQNTGSQNLNLGADNNSYPPARTIIFGVKFGF